MALRDLVADREKLTEDAIERIVADYIRYDPGASEIVLTPEGVALGNDAKVLAVLVAILGWRYVVDAVPQVDTRPASLEALTGIPGGTLRPVLKKLKDGHLITATDGHYVVRTANLDAIARVISGDAEKSPAAGRRVRKTSRKSKATAERPSSDKTGRRTGVPIKASLARLLDQGFFADARTLGQVVGRLHEQAVIAKVTSLSGPIADLVRNGKLERRKTVEGKKEVWGYRAI